MHNRPWRGHHLPVVQLHGQRGGAGGVAWGLDLTRVGPKLLSELPGLTDRLEQADPAPNTPSGDIEPWRVKVQAERFEVIRPAVHTAPGSKERGAALRKIVSQWHMVRAERRKVAYKTVQRWLLDYDKAGLVGLLPEANGKPGVRRVLINRRWDNGIDLAEDAREQVSADLERDAKSLIAKSVSDREVQRLARRRLAELCLAAGSDLPRAKLEALCKLTHRYTGPLRAFRRVARHDFDNKAFFDKDRPRIARGRCHTPMEVVYGDVHPLDIFVEDHERGGQLRLRLIGWMDDHSGYLWATVAVLGKGQGIRQPDIADALFNMVCDPSAGVPRTLYLDNGGEYSALANAMLEIPGAVDAMAFCGGRVLATPYNGPAKGRLEGAFGKLEQGLFKHIPGWIGGDRTNKKTHAVGKPVKGFEGPIEDLVDLVFKMVAAYNDKSQNGLLAGQSPRQAMQAAIARGWTATAMDEAAFDFAFSRREDNRRVVQGRIRFANDFWYSDALAGLGAGDTVDLRIPLRSSARGIFVLHNGELLPGRALPETRYHPLDRAGARESSRRAGIQSASIRALKAQVDPSVDPATELLKGVDDSPLAPGHGAIIRLSDTHPTTDPTDTDEERHAFLEDFLSVAGRREDREADG